MAILTLDRPPFNFIDGPWLSDLGDALEAIDGERSLRASILTATGKVFCAGAGAGAVGGAGGGHGEETAAPSPAGQIARLFAIRKPLVAAIQGAAVGAGLGLALVADFRIATPEARFAANFVQLGLHPGFGISLSLPHVIGAQRSALMLLTARRIKPAEALGWGLIDALVPAAELPAAARAFARELAANAPLAVMATRATLRAELAGAIRRQAEQELREQERLRGTRDFAEGVASVAERRPGRFTGE